MYATAYQAQVANEIAQERAQAIEAGRREFGEGHVDTVFWTGFRWVGDRFQSRRKDHADEGASSVATVVNMARRLAPGGGVLKKASVTCAAHVEYGEIPGEVQKSPYHIRFFKDSRNGQWLQEIKAFAIVAV